MLNAIIRLPRMCEQFQKALRRKMESEQFAKMQSEAVSKLKPYINEKNEQKFMDDFLQELDTKILAKLKHSSPQCNERQSRRHWSPQDTGKAQPNNRPESPVHKITAYVPSMDSSKRQRKYVSAEGPKVEVTRPPSKTEPF